MLNKLIIIMVSSILFTACGEAQFGKLVTEKSLNDGVAAIVPDDSLIGDIPGGDDDKPNKPNDDDKKDPKKPDKKADDAIIKCQQAIDNNKLIQVTKKVFFPESLECNWGGVSPSSFDNWINKRIEQVATVELEDDFTVCDIEFKSERQYMKYDDEILLTLGDVVLFSSVDYSEEHRIANQAIYENIFPDIYAETDGLKTEDGLVQYMWDGLNGIIRNKNLASSDPRPAYCLGNSICEIPESDTQGEIKLGIPQFEILKAAAKSGVKVDEVGESKLDFRFITTGDNDTGDCYHEEFEFDVEVFGYKI